MQRIETSLPGVCELRRTVSSDSRGFFLETYNRRRFAEIDIADSFVQDNLSCCEQGTLRGFHYQLKHPQAKLCYAVEGRVLDAALDIRIGSPHFGKWNATILSAHTHNQIYIPVGFAHAFLSLTENAQFVYKCSDFYDPADEYGVLWSDPELNFPWGIDAPVVSERDAKLPRLASVPRELLPRYESE